MRQVWHDLLFAHWPVDAALLRPHIPAGLEIDTFDGTAWIAVVPFRMSGIRPPGVPALPWISAFAELNVRAYVKRDGRPGVWFFSLDAANPLAVAVARAWFKLPYYRAAMRCEPEGEAIRYQSRRTHSGAAPAELTGAYRPEGSVFEAQPGTLPYFLTARYCLYTASEAGAVYRGEIDHDPWPLQNASAEFARNTMTAGLGIALAGPPLLHFSRRIDVRVWGLRRL